MRHEGYWELRESPFRAGRNPDYFFCSPTHEEALARLHFLADDRRSFGIVSGGEGTGKSLVLQVLARTLRQQGRAACLVSLFGLDAHGFAWTLAASLGTNPAVTEGRFALWRQLSDRLSESRYTGETQTVLLDDADLASREVADLVLQLLKVHSQQHLTVVLAAETSRLAALAPDLLQLCELQIRLESWDSTDVGDYVHTSLVRAGHGNRAEIFDASAVQRLQEVTGGIPRRVCLLAELALVAGAARKLDHIDADTIDAVWQDLSIGPPVDMVSA